MISYSLKECDVYKIMKGKPLKPPLPGERVTNAEPFLTVRIDYSCAITITNTGDDVQYILKLRTNLL